MSTSPTQTDQDLLEWAIGTNRWSLRVCGICRNENRTQDVFSNLLVPLYASIIFIFALFPQVLALVKVWGDMTLVVENLVTSLPLVVTLCKIVTMWYKKTVIIEMLNFIRDDWTKGKSEQERNVMIKYAQVSRMITLGGYFVIATTILVYHTPVAFGVVLRTLTNLTDTGDRPLVLPTIYLIDVYRTPIYELTIICQAIACSIASFCYTTVGALFGMIVLHVCSQLENLKSRIEDMVKFDEENRPIFQNPLMSNIQEHQRLIRFVNMIESTFNVMLLMIVPAFTITVCIQGFQLINTLCDEVKRPVALIIFCVVFIIYIVFVMFVYSSVGQILVTRSEEIQYAVYNCEWYYLRPKEAAQIVVILIRTQQPLYITAGKFVPIDLNTFASLLKTTGGYLSCLLAVHE